MAMKRCPVCGEKYSDTYAECPFCEEEKAFQDGEQIRRSGGHGGRRAAGHQQMNLITPTLIVLILIMAGLLVYLLWGGKIADSLTQSKDETQTPPVEEPQPEEEQPVSDGDGEEEGGMTPGVMPGDTDEEQTSGETEDQTSSGQSGQMDYEQASKLPDGLTLSTTDFTLKNLGESHTITVSGGSGSYTWISEDDGVASVDANGKVTAVSGGTVHVLVTDGSKKGECIVRISASGSLPSGSGSGSTTAKLSNEDFTMAVGDPDVKLTVSGTNSSVAWASKDPSIATVSSSGVVKAVAKGTTTVTATVDGVTLSCIVRVSH